MSRNYLEAFIIVLIAGGLGFFLVLPKYAKLQELDLAIAEKNAEIENREEYFAELSQASIELAQYEANLEKIETAFPEDIDAPAVMNFVQAAAMQSGMVVKSVGYTGAAEKKEAVKGKKAAVDTGDAPMIKLGTYGMEGEFIGSYQNFKDFLTRVEYSSRLISTDTISVSPSISQDSGKKSEQILEDEKKQAADPVLNFKVKLSVNYYQ